MNPCESVAEIMNPETSTYAATHPATDSATDSAPGIRAGISIDPDNVRQGLGKLVLCVIELLRQLMERQAVHRMDRQDLSDDDIERLGQSLLKLDQELARLRAYFGLSQEDINLDLGPLGKLF